MNGVTKIIDFNRVTPHVYLLFPGLEIISDLVQQMTEITSSFILETVVV